MFPNESIGPNKSINQSITQCETNNKIVDNINNANLINKDSGSNYMSNNNVNNNDSQINSNGSRFYEKCKENQYSNWDNGPFIIYVDKLTKCKIQAMTR